MRELKYYVATSVDGFIAHADGTWDGFLAEGEHAEDFFKSYAWFDAVLMGRGTYEVGINQGVTNPYPMLKSYVFSRTMERSPDDNVQLVSSKAVELVRDLKQQEGKDIWLCGGGDLATTFLEARLIDWIILKLNPVAIGIGLPLLTRACRAELELTEHKIYSNGVALMHYRVRG